MNASITVLAICLLAIVSGFVAGYRRRNRPVTMVHVSCHDCPKQLLVSKANVMPGMDFFCVECWKKRRGYQEPDQQNVGGE